MADTGRAGDHENQPTRDRPAAERQPGTKRQAKVSGLLGLQQAAGNAAVSRLVAQRQADTGIAATLQAQEWEQIAAAKARAGQDGTAPPAAGEPPPAGGKPAGSGGQPGAPDPAEKARLRQKLGGTVSPPDPSAERNAAALAADTAKTEVRAPAKPLVAAKNATAPAGGRGTGEGPAAAATAARGLADQAFALASAQSAPTPAAPVQMPEPVLPVDAGGRPVPEDPGGDALAAGLAQRVQALRAGAHVLHVRAAEERANAHTIQGNIRAAESGIAQAEAGVATVREHTAHRRQVADQARQALDTSKQKADTVASGAPDIAARSAEGSAKSSPVATESQGLAAENARRQPEDSEAAGKSREQGNKLTKIGSDMGSIDATIGQTRERAGQLADEAARARQDNAGTEAKLALTEQALARTEQKTAEMAQQNEAARGHLAGLASGPDEILTGTATLDANADALAQASTVLEARIHGAQRGYADGMAAVPARVPRATRASVQRAGYGDRDRVDTGGAVADALPPWLTGEDPPSAAARAEAAEREKQRRRDELAEIDKDAGGQFSHLSASDKAGIALRTTGRHLFGSVGATSFPRFLGGILRGFIDPRASLMGVVSGLGMILSGGANLFSATQWQKDPLGNLLKSAADIATGVTIVLGSIAGLAVAIGVILTAATVLTLGLIAPVTAPIIAFCGTVAATVGPWAITAAEIALVLQGLVFIKNLIDAATAQTAGELQNKSDEMTEDAGNAGNMALQIGMAKAMEAGGKMLRGSGGGGGGGGEGAPPIEGSGTSEIAPANDNAIPPSRPGGPELTDVSGALGDSPAPANDNAVPRTEPMAMTADGYVPPAGAPAPPELRVIEGGAGATDGNATVASGADGPVGGKPTGGPQPITPSVGPDTVPAPEVTPAPELSPSDELTKLIADQKADDAGSGNHGGDHADPLDLAEPLDSGEPVPDPGEPGRIPELDSGEPRPTRQERFMGGNDFNEAQKGAYEAREVRLENNKIVDGYTEGKEIVSRKNTQLADIPPEYAEEYVNEFLDKYGPGNVVADTPANRANCPQLVGKPLQGNLILEVPIQNGPVPTWLAEWARRWNITIRDPAGTVYN